VRKKHIYLVLLLILLFKFESSHSCSMYKLTLHGSTFVGCNEDAWRSTPRLWFESKNAQRKFGAAFTGSRFDGSNGYAPQSGMNESGLSFSRLASYTPARKSDGKKPPILNQTNFLKHVLHSCRTVEEVQRYVSQFDRSTFMEDVLIYIDKSGKYLIVEPYSTQIGWKNTYVLSNFCPSITSKKEALKLYRYRKGIELLNSKLDTTLVFLRSLSDSMHVCRPKIGDGTLLTSILNLNDGKIHLYFYHDYDHNMTFDLKDELKKGDHLLSIDDLFPKNTEFEKLGSYKTTKNTLRIMLSMIFFSCTLFCSAIYFCISFLFKRNKYNYLKLLLAMSGFLVSYYVYVLCTHQNIFYFPAPYEDRFSKVVSLSAYVPNILVLITIPFIYWNFLVMKAKSWTVITRNLFLLNNVIYVLLLCFFAYWRLFWY
jgi:hypothetical protein